MNELNKKLRDKAVLNGLCPEWQGDWKENKSKEDLIEMYKRGIDFCIDHDYPSVKFIKSNFDDSVLNSHGVYIDQEVNLENPDGVIILRDCTGQVNFDRYSTADIYLIESDVRINASGFSRVSVNIHDCKPHLKQSENAKVYAYLHGGDLTHEGGVRVRKREG